MRTTFSILNILFFLLLTGIFSQVSAQTNPKVEEKLAALDDLFDLTDIQTDEIRGVLNHTADQLSEIRPLRQTDRNSFRRERRAIMQEMEAGISASLDREQAARFEQMLQQRREKGQGGGSQVTPEQREKVSKSATISTENAVAQEEPEEEVYIEEIPSGNTETEDVTTDESSEPTTEDWSSDDMSSADSQGDWLENALDFLYDDVLMPRVRNRKRK